MKAILTGLFLFVAASSAFATTSLQSLANELSQRLPLGQVIGQNNGSPCRVIAASYLDQDPSKIERIKVQIVQDGKFVDADFFFDGSDVGLSGSISPTATMVIVQKPGRSVKVMRDPSDSTHTLVTVSEDQREMSCSIAR